MHRQQRWPYCVYNNNARTTNDDEWTEIVYLLNACRHIRHSFKFYYTQSTAKMPLARYSTCMSNIACFVWWQVCPSSFWLWQTMPMFDTVYATHSIVSAYGVCLHLAKKGVQKNIPSYSGGNNSKTTAPHTCRTPLTSAKITWERAGVRTRSALSILGFRLLYDKVCDHVAIKLKLAFRGCRCNSSPVARIRELHRIHIVNFCHLIFAEMLEKSIKFAFILRLWEHLLYG